MKSDCTTRDAAMPCTRSCCAVRCSSQPRLLNAKEAANYLGFKSTASLKRLPIPPVPLRKVGGHPKWDRKALDHWLDECSGLTPHPTPMTASDTQDADDEFKAWELRREARRA